MSVWTCDGCEEGCVVIIKSDDGEPVDCIVYCHEPKWTKVR